MIGFFYIYYYKNNKKMKHLKTFEGLFDIFKKKENVYEDDIWSCFEDLRDERRITTNLRGDYCDGIFPNYEDVFKIASFFNSRINVFNGKELKYKNMIAYQMTYNPNEISDEEVSKILEYSRKKLKIYGCKLSLFIGQGVDEGWASENEYSNLEGVIGAIKKHGQAASKNWEPASEAVTFYMRQNRNIIIKVKAPNDII